jgi:hypothetical protein
MVRALRLGTEGDDRRHHCVVRRLDAVAVVCTAQKERRVHHRRHGLDQTVPILYISSVRIAFRVCRPMTGQDHILDRMVDKAETVLDDMDA